MANEYQYYLTGSNQVHKKSFPDFYYLFSGTAEDLTLVNLDSWSLVFNFRGMSDFTLRTKYLDSILTNPIYMWKIIF